MKTFGNTLILLFLISGTLAAGDQGKLVSKEYTVLKKGPQNLELREGFWNHRLGVVQTERNTRSVFDTIDIYYAPEYPEDYSDFMAGYQTTGNDSILTRYHLLTDGIVNEVHFMNENGGLVEVWIYGPAYLWVDSDGDGVEDIGYSQFPGDVYADNEGQYPVTIELLSLTEITQEFHTSVPANHFNSDGDWEPWLASTGTGWNVVNFADVFGTGITIESGTGAGQIDDPSDQLYIWVGYAQAPTASNTDIATIYQDGSSHFESEEGGAPSYSTLHSVAESGWYIIWTGNDDWYAHIQQIVVQYDAVPPIVEEMADYSDTFDETKRIWADVIDLDGDAFVCTLMTVISDADGSSSSNYPMLADASISGRYYADVSLEVGDTLRYQVYAEDVTGRGNTGNIGSFMRVQDPIYSQTTLLIQDGTIDTLTLYNSGTGLNPILGGSEFTKYYIWNVSERNGIDSSVVNHSTFKTIVKHGWGGSSMAATGPDKNGYSEFLNRGGRILYSDMDYFFAAGLPANGTFSEGDFAFDYLGLSNYVNDPDNDNDASNGGYGDVSAYGVTADPITSNWVSSAFTIDFESIGWPNWGDFTGAVSGGNASSIFTGGESYETIAVKNYDMGNDAPYKTVYFGFPIETGSANSWGDFSSLLEESLDWLMGTGGPSTAPSLITPADNDTIIITDDNLAATSVTFMVAAGTVSDPDGDMIGLKLNFADGLEGFDVPAIEKSTVNSIAVPYYDLASFVGLGNTVTGTWTATATDGTEGAESSSRSFTVVVNATQLGVDEPQVAGEFRLNANYPNPFNPETKIQFEVPQNSLVQVRILDVRGREITTLRRANYSPGTHTVKWDGRNGVGRRVTSGIYFYEVTAFDPSTGQVSFKDVNKMLLLK